MPFCSKCGAEVTGKFCDKCGAAIEAGPGQPPPARPAASSGGLEENVACALCYLAGFITGIIFLVIEPFNRNKTVRFHAFQSIFLNVGILIVYFVLMVVSIVLSMISGVLGTLVSLVSTLVWLASVGVWIYMMYSAYQRKKVVLPVIGPLAEKQA